MKFRPLLVAACLLTGSSVANAATIFINFEGLANGESIGSFYNGGTGGAASGPGPSFGVVFVNAVTYIDRDAGGTGNFANEPSPSTAATFINPTSAILNVLNGFDTSLAFYYTSVSNPASVRVFDGLNATGNLLATLPLSPLGRSCGGDPDGEFNCWRQVSVAFTGVAYSVDFGGTVNRVGLDNITLTRTMVPEPATGLLLGAALAAWVRRRSTRTPH